jgi:hypothetical protein
LLSVVHHPVDEVEDGVMIFVHQLLVCLIIPTQRPLNEMRVFSPRINLALLFRVNSFAFMPCMGISQGMLPLVLPRRC